MDRSKALAKIRKCLALAQSANPTEAATALRQAQALMREHGLTDLDVTLAQVTEHTTDSRMQQLTPWEAMLATTVADAFGCRLHTGRRQRYPGAALNNTHRRTFIFVGVGAAPEVASYTYDVLARQCAKGRLAHIRAQPKSCKPITKTARGDEWARGWVIGVEQQVRAFATMDRDDALLQAYLDKNHPGMTSAPIRNRALGRNVTVENGLGAGFDASKHARLDRGLGAQAQPGLLA